MGIIIDLILVIIVALSAFLGYKKGIVELGAKLFAGIIAIILTVMLFRPVSNFIINNTQIDEKLTNTIVEKAATTFDEKTNISDNEYVQKVTDGVTTQLKEETIPRSSRKFIKKHSLCSYSNSIIYSYKNRIKNCN